MYLVAIAVLLYPVYELSHPASVDAEGNRTAGGKLAQLRERVWIGTGVAGRNRSDRAKRFSWPRWACAAWRCRFFGIEPHDYQKNEDWNSLVGGRSSRLSRLQPQFLVGVGFSRAQSVVQHFGRVRRLPRSILLGDEGDRIFKKGSGIQQYGSAIFGAGSDGSTAIRSARPTSIRNIVSCSASSRRMQGKS